MTQSIPSTLTSYLHIWYLLCRRKNYPRLLQAWHPMPPSPQHTSLAFPTKSITSRLAPMGTNPPPPWEQRAPCESPRTMGWINEPILQTVLWMHLPQSLPSSKRAMVVLRTNLPEPGLIHPVSRKSLVWYVILNTCTSARNDAANTR